MNKRERILAELVNASIAKWFCEHCWDPVSDKQYTLCTKHYDLFRTTNDYQYICSKQSSPEYRNLLGIWDIYANAIECKKCGSIAISTNWHHMAWCKCWACATDGGSYYLRRLGNPEDYIDRSISFTHL